MSNPTAIYPSSYNQYPTLSSLHKWITKSGISAVELSKSDVECLLDRLIFDDKITKIVLTRGNALGETSMSESEWDGDEKVVSSETFVYKAVRTALDSKNPLTDIPCGKCPVLEFCKDDGPVSPQGCLYFKQWLSEF